MCGLIRKIKFKNHTNEFLDQLQEDVKKIEDCENLIVKGDKTRNWYEVPVAEYDKLLWENISKSYKKTERETLDEANYCAAAIAQQLGLADRMLTFREVSAFLSLKDHKDCFQARKPCRLLNPAKGDMGRVSKQILEKINFVPF